MQKSGPKEPPQSVSPTPTTVELSRDVLLESGSPKRRENESIPPPDHGSLKFGDSGTSYVQSAHWEAILDGIKGLKEDLATDHDIPRAPLLLYGANRHASRDEILAAIPPRPIVDRLLSQHFNSVDIIPCQ